MKRKLIITAAITMFCAFAAQASAAGKYGHLVAPLSICPQQPAGPEEIKEMQCLVKFARKKKHLATLRTDKKLTRAANLKGKRIFECDEFTHEPCGDQWDLVFKQAKFQGRSWGENLASSTIYDSQDNTARDLFVAWIYSAGHRKNLLTPGYRLQGISRTMGDLGGELSVLWVHAFGRK